MYSLIYVSSAALTFTRAQLRDLLTVCERNNLRDGITGMLLYKDGNFMQVLEGAEETVRRVYARIAADERHDGLIILLEEPQSERQFPGWSMGFVDLDSAAPTPQAFNEFLNTPLTGAEFAPNPGRAQHLLLAFKINT